MPKSRRLSDATLVRRSQQGDRRAFAALLTRYDRRLRGLTHALVLDRRQMDAAMGLAYLRAWRDVVRISPRDEVGPWLYRSVYNACIDQLRRGEPPADATAGLAAGLVALAPADRVAVVLVEREGFTARSAARILGMGVDVIEARLAVARDRLAPWVPEVPSTAGAAPSPDPVGGPSSAAPVGAVALPVGAMALPAGDADIDSAPPDLSEEIVIAAEDAAALRAAAAGVEGSAEGPGRGGPPASGRGAPADPEQEQEEERGGDGVPPARVVGEPAAAGGDADRGPGMPAAPADGDGAVGDGVAGDDAVAAAAAGDAASGDAAVGVGPGRRATSGSEEAPAVTPTPAGSGGERPVAGSRGAATSEGTVTHTRVPADRGRGRRGRRRARDTARRGTAEAEGPDGAGGVSNAR
ncbi:MAG TPA: hypothetical protein VFW63_09685 [Acidimicrobiales bacterium]|nr:hypothetical protein [Acidimicrobiales bacterium]